MNQRLLKQAIARHLELGEKHSAASCMARLANLHRDNGHMQEALSLYDEAISLFRDLLDSSSEGTCLGERAILRHWMQGPSSELHSSFEESERSLRIANARGELGKILCGWAHLFLDEERSANHQITEASQIAEELQASERNQLQERLVCVLRAQKDIQSGQGHLLVRGRRIADIPEPIRDWLLNAELPISLFVEMR
jgi:tetratricopeptide (TPR) repeat protein